MRVWSAGRSRIVAAFAILLFGSGLAADASARAGDPRLRFEVSLQPGVVDGPVTGRAVVAVSKEGEREPRLLVGINGPALFGVDVEQLSGKRTATIDAGADAFPMESLRELPAGEYYVQAYLIRYDEVHRADGRTLWVPKYPDRTSWATLQGNLYSDVKKLKLDPKAGFDVKLALAHETGPTPQPTDTKWIKHVRIQSDLLSKFWGIPIYLSAAVLLPKGFEEHPDARYPALYAMSHGPRPYSFTEKPSTAAEEAMARDGNVTTGYEFQKQWTSEEFPRVVAIAMFQPSPFWLEGYSVDSANNGPYGQAITTELIPYLERTFRLIPQSWARVVQGASTGGWETLAMQVKYPDFFGGAWVFNPDPIDFRHWQQVNIYKDENFLSQKFGQFLEEERGMRRTVEGQITVSMRHYVRLEAVQGSRSRGAGQQDAWQAVYAPVGPDGYPAQLFDKKTGVIDHKVAEAMREGGYDLSDYTRRNWATLGPKLEGKLNFFAGEMDNFYLNLAVYDFQDMLREVAGPNYKARFEYGRPKKGHNWHKTDFAEMVREIAAHMRKNAPRGENTAQWNY
jgi:Putative esterase